MAITFSGIQSTVVAATSVTTTTPAAPGGGALSSSNVIFAMVGVGGTASEWAGYAAAGWNRVFWEPGSSSRLHVLWRQATASEPANYTFGAYTSSTVDYGIMFSCAGIDTTTPVNTSSSDFGTTNSTTLVAPAISPGITNAMLFWFGLARANLITTSTTATSTGTELFDINGLTADASRGVMAGYHEQLSASGSTGTRTITLAQSSGNRGMGTLALNPAPTMIETVGMIPIG